MRWGCWILYVVLLTVFVSCENHGEVKKDYWDNGNLKSVLRYQDGQLNGICEWYLISGKRQMEVPYKDNKMNGLLRRWYENGNIMEESWYKDGVQDSISRSYSLKGILVEEGYYVDGKLNGEYKRWYENGQVFQEGQYADDMMDGSWLIFYPDGSLAATANFDKGKGT